MLDLHTVFEATEASDGDRTVSLRVVPVGRLTTSGWIVARDPLAGDAAPFARRFAPGVHEVELLLETAQDDTRVALARVVFSREAPVGFELALREGEDVRALAPGQLFGFGVDAGTACFCDASEDANPNALLADLEAHMATTWSWAVALDEGGGHRMVAFSSGYGDGIYSSWVGLDASGEPVCLVTDFGCLDLDLPALPDDPDHRRVHAERALARMLTFVPDLDGDGRGAAYQAAAEVWGSPADAAHLVPSLLDRYFRTTWESEADLLRYVLAGLLTAPAAQRALAERVPDLDAPRLANLLSKARLGELDDALFDAVLIDAVLARAALEPRLAAAALDIASRRPTVGVRAAAVALTALRGSSDAALRSALGLLGRPFAEGELEHPIVPLDADQLARVGEIAHDHEDESVRSGALSLLVAHEVPVDEGLDDSDPRRRFETAKALSRQPAHRERADATLCTLALDPSLDLALRFDATGRIAGAPDRVRAYEALAMAAHPAANIQLRTIGGEEAMAALERVARDAPDESIRSDADKWIARMRKQGEG